MMILTKDFTPKRSGTWQHHLFALFIIFMPVFITSCSKEKKLNEKLTFWKNDKIPYGTFYAFENLERMFPDVDININKTSPDKYNLNNIEDFAKEESDSGKNGKSALIIISPVVAPDRKELQAMMNYISEGNHVFISAMAFSDNMLDSLRLKTRLESGFESMDDFRASTREIRDAIHAHFAFQADIKKRELKDLLRHGAISLVIGLVFLGICSYFGNGSLPKSASFLEIMRHESLFILAWYAMWKPVSTFLYDWWPMAESMQLYRRLSRIDVEVKAREE
ncbi:MAG: hypothetical protein EOO02_23720, partial [Chitinophagaceae bacterium]